MPSSIKVTTIGALKVSQSLTLECSIATVRGITSSVDILWSSNGSELKRIIGANVNFTSNNLEMYIVFYDILQLKTSDDGRLFQCEILLNTTPSVMATGNITLDLTGNLI